MSRKLAHVIVYELRDVNNLHIYPVTNSHLVNIDSGMGKPIDKIMKIFYA